MTSSEGPLSGEDFLPQLVESISRRYGLNAGKSLWDVYRLSQDFLTLDPTAFDFMVAHREQILRSLADPQVSARLVELFVQSTLEFTYASNQFVTLDAAEEDVLRGIYRQYLRAMHGLLAAETSPDALRTGMQGVIDQHFERLKANIARFFDEETAADLRANVILRQAVCSEYTPEFQLSVLGLRLEDLREPVLDIGCGKSGALVTYLNQNGVRAVGVDRVAAPSPHLCKADWLRLDLAPAAWGTILSHMAFSNHFTFHHLYKHGSAEAYARQYMAILDALEPGGSFHYCPGLPFIERLLPIGRYRVERIPVSDRRSGEFFATRVERLP